MKHKIVSVAKDTIAFTREGGKGTLGVLLNPIIYNYIPGATVVLDAHGDYWHLEDFKRVKHLDNLIGLEFDSYDEMMSKCNDWR